MISFEEMENDFNALKARSEEVKVENELLHILRNSTKDTSLDDDIKDKNKIRSTMTINIYKFRNNNNEEEDADKEEDGDEF